MGKSSSRAINVRRFCNGFKRTTTHSQKEYELVQSHYNCFLSCFTIPGNYSCNVSCFRHQAFCDCKQRSKFDQAKICNHHNPHFGVLSVDNSSTTFSHQQVHSLAFLLASALLPTTTWRIEYIAGGCY